MTATEETLGKFIEKAAVEAWEGKQAPYFLSALAPDFERDGHNYKDIIRDERLKSAVKRLSEIYNFAVVEHPTQRAKIGVIPKGQEFSFEVDHASTPRETFDSMSDSNGHRQKIVIEFFEALGRLPPDLLDEVVIPTKVLIRLLAGK